MKSTRLIISCALVLSYSLNAICATEENSAAVSQSSAQVINDSGLPTINESWYVFFDTGITNDKYAGALGDKKSDIDNFDTSGSDTNSRGLGLSVGFYFPVNNHKTMIGPYLSIGSSTYDLEKQDSFYDLQVTTNKVDMSFSAQHYFGKNIGTGFFLRGDVGISRVELEVENTNFCFDSADCKDMIRFRDGSTWSFDSYGQTRSIEQTSPLALIGMGGSWGLGKKLRMQTLLSHTFRPGSDGSINTTNLALGMLF